MNNEIYIYRPGSNPYLAHYGVIGQKWGVRNYQNPDGTLTAKGKQRLKSDKVSRKEAREERRQAKREQNIKSVSSRRATDSRGLRKSMTNISDEELRQLVNRIRLENEYDKLISEQTKIRIDSGKRFVKEFTDVVDNNAKRASTGLDIALKYKQLTSPIGGKKKG